MKRFYALAAVMFVAVPLSAGVLVSGSEDWPVWWLRLEAERGNNASAQYNLGLMYYYGEGVPQDFTQAVKWFRMAAEQGLANAQCNLGVMYDEGRGVPQDFTQAVKWYRMAAEQGYTPAQYNLGVMYNEGRGVPQDLVQAYAWFDLAATMAGMEWAIAMRDEAASRMTREQIAEAQRLSRMWFEHLRR